MCVCIKFLLKVISILTGFSRAQAKEIQKMLNDAGFNTVVDGYIGEATMTSLRCVFREFDLKNKIDLILEGEQKIMSAVEDLKNIVTVLVNDAVTEANAVGEAVSLLRQLVDAGKTDNPDVVDAVQKLEQAHEAFMAATQSLKDEVDADTVPAANTANT